MIYYAAAGILHHRETNLEILTKASIEYESAQTDADAATAGKRMFAALEDQLKLDIAWTGVTRKAAQIMRIAQTSHESALAASLPVGTEFKQTVAPEVAKKQLKKDSLQYKECLEKVFISLLLLLLDLLGVLNYMADYSAMFQFLISHLLINVSLIYLEN